MRHSISARPHSRRRGDRAGQDGALGGGHLVKFGKEQVEDDTPASLREEERYAQRQLFELVLDGLAALFDAGLPAAILIDDAHFSTADPSMTLFTAVLIDHAWRKNWPLLLAKNEGKEQKAREHFARYHEIVERLAAELGTPEALRDISVSHFNLGKLSRKEKDWCAAEEHYKKAFDIALSLVKAHPDVTLFRRDKANWLHKLAFVDEVRGRTESARTKFETARYNALVAASTPPDVEDKKLLAEIDEALAWLRRGALVSFA